ncbi:MAG TPA: hypothetical protein VND98_06995 [Solirubrobacterales bacterium]|nr:hypothetical protein [Solirubrobacterales bacterium]
MPRRALAAVFLAGLLAGLVVLAQPSPPPARANIACEVASGPAHAITGGIGAITGGAIGGGNPVGDACNSLTDGVVGAVTSPITNALKGIGSGIFSQITSWVSEGAIWLIGQVVSAIEQTTTPQLTTAGFLSEYGRMAEVAVFLAAAMLLFAVLEGVAQGNSGLLVRVVLVNLPLAFLATSVAYIVVQLLLIATDGLCHAIAVATAHNSQRFFHAAIGDLGKAGGTAGKAIGGEGGANPAGGATGQLAGATAVPLFVTFLAAIIGAFAAFFVWIELLMRDAAVYVVALFMPLALAASIWPRWSGALRRSGELLVVVIASKFVIVSIISLAAGLIAENDGQVEHILAASALMLLACFAPFVLFKLVPFAEGAMAAAYGRRSAAGGAMSGMQIAGESQILRNMARSNWGGSSTAQGGGAQSGGAPGPEPGKGGGGRGPGAGKPGGGGGRAAAGSEAGAAGALAAAPVAIAAAATRGARGAARRLEQSGTAQAAGDAASAQPRPSEDSGAAGGVEAPVGEQPPRPAPELPAKREEKKAK